MSYNRGEFALSRVILFPQPDTQRSFTSVEVSERGGGPLFSGARLRTGIYPRGPASTGRAPRLWWKPPKTTKSILDNSRSKTERIILLFSLTNPSSEFAGEGCIAFWNVSSRLSPATNSLQIIRRESQVPSWINRVNLRLFDYIHRSFVERNTWSLWTGGGWITFRNKKLYFWTESLKIRRFRSLVRRFSM